MATCYFTYSWEKDKKEEDSMKCLLFYLKEKIEEMSSHAVTVTYDRESFREGDDFRKCEKEIKKSDCIVIFFTPEYKRKIDSKIDAGAYREFELIKNRARDGDSSIIPILLIGDKKSAIPEDFKSRIYWDLTQLRGRFVQSRGKMKPEDVLKKKLIEIAKKAIKEARATEYYKEYDFASIEEEYQKLFLNTAAGPLPSNCVIKTSAHERVISQATFFIIGRKGSGKTTLLNTIQRDGSRYFQTTYKRLASVDADTFDIGFIFDNLITKVRNDLRVLNLENVLDTFWMMVFFLQGMLIVGFELEDYEIDEHDNRYDTFKKISNKLKKFLGIPLRKPFSTNLSKGAVCRCAVELLSDHILHDVLNNASRETPLTGAYNSVDAFNILSKKFGERLFEKYCLCVRQCTRKIFLALDGFDPHSEDFRKRTNRFINTNKEEYYFRKDFEVRLFRELLITVSKIKNEDITPLERDYFSAVHFCIIIPQDRYDEIAVDDRDIAKRGFCSLSWDAHDLLEMLIKRLEHYYQIEENLAESNLEKRFYEIIRNKMPNIPTNINVSIDGYPVSMPLFNYMLRLTFWRPRDIIINFAIIMQLNESGGYSQDIISNIIKKFLVSGARKIIEDEFIGEYRNVYLNFEEILFEFQDADIIQELDAFCEHLSNIKIVSISSKKISTTGDKLRLLYKLGVIGLYFTPQDAQKHGYGHHICYCFNEGLNPVDDFLLRGSKDSKVKIIFNPIFAKRLSLNYNTKELICNFSWEYIKTNHELKDNIRRI